MVPFKNTGNLSGPLKFNKKCQKPGLLKNAFGFLKGRFRRLKYIDADIERIPKIVKASCGPDLRW